MKKTLKNIGLGATLAGALVIAGCSNKRDSRLPKVRDNQTLILHPSYLNGTSSLGYTILTDIDNDGTWDVAERYHAGFTPSDSIHKFYFKKGFGPAQGVNPEMDFVEPEFFDPYQ